MNISDDQIDKFITLVLKGREGMSLGVWTRTRDHDRETYRDADEYHLKAARRLIAGGLTAERASEVLNIICTMYDPDLIKCLVSVRMLHENIRRNERRKGEELKRTTPVRERPELRLVHATPEPEPPTAA